jgi:hypothetical protein
MQNFREGGSNYVPLKLTGHSVAVGTLNVTERLILSYFVAFIAVYGLLFTVYG